MELSQTRVRALRLHAHHLDKPLPAGGLLQAAAACGLQNSPPGAWETAAFNRVEDCSVCSLHTALHHDKTLLQAWSYRGVPVVFPTRDAGVFLTPLCARPGEAPWMRTTRRWGRHTMVSPSREIQPARTQVWSAQFASTTAARPPEISRTL